MKKLMKRIGAVLMAVAMMAALGVSAWAIAPEPESDPEPTPAATVDYDTPLKVNGLAKDDVVSFYKVIEWVGDAAGNVSGWKATATFADILTETKLKEVLVGTEAVGTEGQDGYVAAKEPTGITSELAGQLARAAADAAKVGDDISVTGTEAQLNNEAPGMYMALITPANQDVVYNPVFVSADYNKTEGGQAVSVGSTYSGEATAKKSTVELTKQATVTETNPPYDELSTTTRVGEIVNFTVTTTIPGYGDVYTAPVFNITDKLNALELVANSVTITAPTGIDETKATITEGTDNYKIVFKSDYLKTVKTATTVTVTYQAKVTTDALKHVNTEKNTVTTEFSHNPNDENDHGFKKDTTQHYTFTLDAEGLGSTSTQAGKKTSELVKIGQKANGEPITSTRTTSEITDTNYVEGPLAGAKFKLYTTKVSDTEATDEYVKADGTKYEISSGTDGRMNIAGLDAGTYYLQESEAPAGYVRDTKVHTIVIAATTTPVELTEYTTDGTTWISAEDYNNLDATAKADYKSYTYTTDVLSEYTVKIDGEDTATYKFTNKGTDAEIIWTETPPVELPFDIINIQGTELPSTGGIGTYVFTVAGVAIMAIAAGLLIVRHKKKAE